MKELELSFDEDLTALTSLATGDMLVIYDASASSGQKIKKVTLTTLYNYIKGLIDTAYGSFVTRWPTFAEVTSKPVHYNGTNVTTASVSGMYIVAADTASHHHITLSGNVTLNFPAPATSNECYVMLTVVQNGIGGHTITWGTGTRLAASGTAPSMTTTANAKDIVMFYFTGGSWYMVSFVKNVSAF